jgi:hypothetical protein
MDHSIQFKDGRGLIVEYIQSPKCALTFCIADLFNRWPDDLRKSKINCLKSAPQREDDKIAVRVPRSKFVSYSLGNAAPPSVNIGVRVPRVRLGHEAAGIRVARFVYGPLASQWCPPIQPSCFVS